MVRIPKLTEQRTSQNGDSSILCTILDFQEAFQLFDQKGDGRVQVSQIGDILRALGQNPTESDVKKLTHNHRPGEQINLK